MDSELVDVPECLITKREMEDTPVRFPYTLGGACACFLVECTRANSITRPENGEESFETLGFEKNFVRTINNMTQRRNTFRKADEKSRDGSFARRDHLDGEGEGGREKKGGKRRDDITFTREKSLDISRRTTRRSRDITSRILQDRANVSNLTSLDFHKLDVETTNFRSSPSWKTRAAKQFVRSNTCAIASEYINVHSRVYRTAAEKRRACAHGD